MLLIPVVPPKKFPAYIQTIGNESVLDHLHYINLGISVKILKTKNDSGELAVKWMLFLIQIAK
jgi:hypothetical protein